MRSSSSGSAQWTSSNRNTIGPRRAAFSTRRRTAQNVSSGSPGSPTPRSAAAPAAIRSRSGSSSSNSAVSAATHRLGARIVVERRGLAERGGDRRERGAAGRPRSARRPPAPGRRPRAASSRASRVLPTPGEPTIDASRARRVDDGVVEDGEEPLQLAGPARRTARSRSSSPWAERQQEERVDRAPTSP